MIKYGEAFASPFIYLKVNMKFNYRSFREKSIENILKFLSNTKQVVLLFLIVLITLSAIFYNISKNKDVKNSNNQNEENAIQKIPSEMAYFRTEVENIRVKTEVKIKYRLPEKQSAVWFGFFPDKDINRPVYLINHPIFNDLNWEKVDNSEYTLFQRSKNYDSVEEFLSNPPIDKKIIVDSVIYEYGVLKTDNVLKLENDFFEIGDDIYYILTTFHKPYKDGDWLVFERIIDASGAFIEDDKMTWYLQLIGVSENNPFFMNGVHVDFIQPGQIIKQ